jgi:hypothetical protein
MHGVGAMNTAQTRVLPLPLLRPAAACSLAVIAIILFLPLEGEHTNTRLSQAQTPT